MAVFASFILSLHVIFGFPNLVVDQLIYKYLIGTASCRMISFSKGLAKLIER